MTRYFLGTLWLAGKPAGFVLIPGLKNATGIDSNTPLEYHRVMKPKIKKRIIHRLRILEGQVRGLQKMVAKEEYCIDILQQSGAVKKALSGIEDLILENHLSTHVIEQVRTGRESKATKEILEIYKLSKRK